MLLQDGGMFLQHGGISIQDDRVLAEERLALKVIIKR
jgi:hypothetical protein